MAASIYLSKPQTVYNPQYSLTVHERTHVQLLLETSDPTVEVMLMLH